LGWAILWLPAHQNPASALNQNYVLLNTTRIQRSIHIMAMKKLANLKTTGIFLEIIQKKSQVLTGFFEIGTFSTCKVFIVTFI